MRKILFCLFILVLASCSSSSDSSPSVTSVPVDSEEVSTVSDETNKQADSFEDIVYYVEGSPVDPDSVIQNSTGAWLVDLEQLESDSIDDPEIDLTDAVSVEVFGVRNDGQLIKLDPITNTKYDFISNSALDSASLSEGTALIEISNSSGSSTFYSIGWATENSSGTFFSPPVSPGLTAKLAFTAADEPGFEITNVEETPASSSLDSFVSVSDRTIVYSFEEAPDTDLVVAYLGQVENDVLVDWSVHTLEGLSGEVTIEPGFSADTEIILLGVKAQ